MKKRFLWILFISLSISVLLAGCGGSELKTKVQTPEEAAKMQGDPLQNLAAKEEKWLDKLDKVHSAVAESYKQWEQGKLTRQLLNEQLDKEYNKVRALKKSYDMHIKANPLPPEAKDEKVYYQGLQYGKKLRSLVNNFTFVAVEGVTDSKTKKKKPLTDEELKTLYNREMVEKYDQYRNELNKALSDPKFNISTSEKDKEAK